MADEKRSLDDADSRASPASLHTAVEPQLDPQAEAEVVALARTFTHTSKKSHPGEEIDNPFDGSADPRLDPASGKFNLDFWIKSVLSLASRDPDRFPKRTAGVSWKGLNVYGYGRATDHQKTVLNILLDSPRLVLDYFGRGGSKRIDILRNFEGCVLLSSLTILLHFRLSTL
jgi:ATP-binding cassette subfamily G (WHITE) protein 2 (PDR)